MEFKNDSTVSLYNIVIIICVILFKLRHRKKKVKYKFHNISIKRMWYTCNLSMKHLLKKNHSEKFFVASRSSFFLF